MIIVEPEHLTSRSLQATICIIGSGPAGITLANELNGIGASVLLLEAGALRSTTPASAGLTPPGAAEAALPSGMRRIGFGGTSAVWGGRCVPFDPIDFERREHVPYSGWPISYHEVERHYAKALEYCDAGEYNFSLTGSLKQCEPTIPGLEQSADIVSDRLERFSLPTDFGMRYRENIERSRNVTAVLNTRCVALNKSRATGLVESATVIDRSGSRRRVTADVFVIATGGIEGPRLLFSSDPEGPGLGNRTDRLGRFFACHFSHVGGRLVPNGAAVQAHFERTRDGIYAGRKLYLSPAALERERLLNVAFRLRAPPYGDPRHGSSSLSALHLAKMLLQRSYRDGTSFAGFGKHLLNVSIGIPELARFGWRRLLSRTLADRKHPGTLTPANDGSVTIELNSEQAPSESSRIKPARPTDRYGMRAVDVDWHLSTVDVDSAWKALCVLRENIQRHTRCALELDDRDREALGSARPQAGHHIGTTRMAASANDGVVDKDCALFDSANVYIAGCSVFPTSSHANPMLTTVALSLRLAEHLKRRIDTPRAIG